MTGPFIELSEHETSKAMWVNAALVACVIPHGRSGSYIYFTGRTDRLEVDESPGEVAARLYAAGVAGASRRGEE